MKECDFDQDFFIRLVFAHFPSIWYEKRAIQQLNARTFLIPKNYANIPINVRTTAC